MQETGSYSNGVVTPEAVFLQFDTAGVGSRTAAAFIDFLIKSLGVLAFVLVGTVLADVGGPSWVAVTVATFGLFVLAFGYSIIFETFWSGRTPGKALLGLRVVTVEGAPIRFRHAAIRGMLGAFEIVVTSGIVAAISIMSTRRNQRLGDLIAGTLVLRERKAAGTPVATSFIPPPGTEEYALTLDVSALTTDDYGNIRSFLLRSGQLDPVARQGLADQLGRQYVGRLRTAPPSWMPSEVFLVCVAAAYQRRYSN